MPTYSPLDWDYLTHFHEYEWPDEWDTLRDDRDGWRPAVERLCAEHGLHLHGEIAPTPGSNLAIVLDDVVIKIFARRNPIWLPREIEALQVLEAIPEAMTPRLIAEGELTHNDRVHPYIIMERLPGTPFRLCWNVMTQEDRASITQQLGPVIRALHSAPITGLRSFGTSPQEWVRRMQRRAALRRDYYSDGMPQPLLEQISEYLDRNLASITHEFTPHLLSADVIGGNILVEQRHGEWKITGLIDFGDVEVGPVEYEWVSLCHKALRSEAALIAEFFDSYGSPLPFSDEARTRMNVYTLLHRFSVLPFVVEANPEIDELDVILKLLWPMVEPANS